jgi:hypothetical protein
MALSCIGLPHVAESSPVRIVASNCVPTDWSRAAFATTRRVAQRRWRLSTNGPRERGKSARQTLSMHIIAPLKPTGGLSGPPPVVKTCNRCEIAG